MKITFDNFQSPGDLIAMTGAIRDLKAQYPEYEIAMNTACSDVWINNPNVSWFPMSETDKRMYLDYPDIHHSADSGRHFSNAFHLKLEDLLGIRLKQTAIWPEIYLTEAEKNGPTKLSEIITYNGGPYWILNAGYKHDFPLKHWGHERYQALADILRGRVQFVQVGEDSPGHVHYPIDGAINLVGATNTRELFALMYRAQGSVGPVSMHLHIAAAFRKPCVIIAGGREPYRWESYPNQRYLHTNGLYKCCQFGGCWRKWLPHQIDTVIRGNEPNWEKKTCDNLEGSSARCMAAITPEMVAKEILAYIEGGTL